MRYADGVNPCTRGQLIEHFETGSNGAEYGVPPLEMWSGAVGKEELATFSVFSRRSHADNAGAVA